MRSQKGLRTIEKGVNNNEHWYKMFENAQMIDFGEHFNQILGQILSASKYDRDKPIFSSKCGVNKIELVIKRDPTGSDNVKK